jgi:hypothetical protein
MTKFQASRLGHSGGEPLAARIAARNDLIVLVIAVTAALLLDLVVFAFMASH